MSDCLFPVRGATVACMPPHPAGDVVVWAEMSDFQKGFFHRGYEKTSCL